MQEMTMDEVEQVEGGLIFLLVLLLGGCATIHGPNNENLQR